MNREIKFRGKSLDNNEWVYGFFVCMRDTGRKPIDKRERITHRIYSGFADSCASEIGYDFFGDWTEVNPNTVGQFTGMYDKNGKEIYEGDIVKYYRITDFNIGRDWNEPSDYYIEECIDEIVFELGQYCTKEDPTLSLMYLTDLDKCENPDSIEDEYGFISNQEKYPFIKTTNDIFYAEIIGNIHDNPELLKGGDK